MTAIYLHIPFCRRKCPYCHFYSIKTEARLTQDFCLAMQREWRLKEPLLQGSRVTSVYFGGGTPLSIGYANIAKMLNRMEKQLVAGCEITLEANPLDINAETARHLMAIGINRVSLGAQSFNDDELRLLGRTHKARDTVKALDLLANAGINNLSVDLMFDLPDQTTKEWQKTLLALEELPISHLSLYNLEIWPKTPFHRRKGLLPPTEKESLKMLKMAVSSLKTLGLQRYEISAFAKKGYESRHNTGYWTGTPFLGLGPSAYSYREGKRFANFANLSLYCKLLSTGQEPIEFHEELSYPANLKEMLAINLRLLCGVDIDKFEQKYGPLPDETLLLLKSSDLIIFKKNRCKLSAKGLLFYDTLAEELI